MSKKDVKKFVATPMQARVVFALTNPEERRSIRKVLGELGINRENYYNWLKDPDFYKYMSEQVMISLKGSLTTVSRALVREAGKGSHQHIKTYLEMVDQYTQKVDININNDDMKKMSDEELKNILKEVESEE